MSVKSIQEIAKIATTLTRPFLSDPKHLAAVRDSFSDVISEWAPPNLYSKVNLVDAVFVFRFLLGRNPDPERELPWLVEGSAHGTLREFLSQIVSSEEFMKRGGFIPPNHLLMSELENFRFWFDTRDTEMGVKMGFGLYEPETIAFFRQTITQGMTCWDIGAQTGFFTCLFAALTGKSGKVVAYEPLPRTFEILGKNVRENAFGGRVTAHNAACSDAPGQVRMLETSNMLVVDAEAKNARPVDCVRLDQEQIPSPDLIKIDVEGHEPAVLRGLSGVLERCNPIIALELNEYWLSKNSGSTGASVILSLERAGFTAFRMETPFEPIRGRSFRQAELENCNIVARRV
jgi:FkbM family methyltransferase